MTFGDALEWMKAGQKMTREGWVCRDVIYAKYTREGIRPYLVTQSLKCEPIPYTATDADIFADDWEVVP